MADYTSRHGVVTVDMSQKDYSQETVGFILPRTTREPGHAPRPDSRIIFWRLETADDISRGETVQIHCDRWNEATDRMPEVVNIGPEFTRAYRNAVAMTDGGVLDLGLRI